VGPAYCFSLLLFLVLQLNLFRKHGACSGTCSRIEEKRRLLIEAEEDLTCPLRSWRSVTWRRRKPSTVSGSAWRRGVFHCSIQIVSALHSFVLDLSFSELTNFLFLSVIYIVAGYARSQGRSPVTFGPTDLVCCRTLQGHAGKVFNSLFCFIIYGDYLLIRSHSFTVTYSTFHLGACAKP